MPTTEITRSTVLQEPEAQEKFSPFIWHPLRGLRKYRATSQIASEVAHLIKRVKSIDEQIILGKDMMKGYLDPHGTPGYMFMEGAAVARAEQKFARARRGSRYSKSLAAVIRKEEDEVVRKLSRSTDNEAKETLIQAYNQGKAFVQLHQDFLSA